MMAIGARRPVVLIILDGWGIAPAGPGNAVEQARTPNFDRLWSDHPTTTMSASGLDVGLPDGQMGNSEVGHLNLGAGRVVHQDLTRIDMAIAGGELPGNKALAGALATARVEGATLHVVGLCSSGGVHSSLAHIRELVRQAAASNVARIRIHAITDGRDVSPQASLDDIPALEHEMRGIPGASIATVVGRYWAMDRDRRWDRTKRAWDAIVHADAPLRSASAAEAVRSSHAAGTTDEFVEPTVIGEGAAVRDGDVVLFANFRPDRMRQLVHAFADGSSFDEFDRGRVPSAHLVCMAQYDGHLSLPLLFPPSHVVDTLADVVSSHGLGQLHVAETEKYAHVTYFFNGGIEHVHAGEDRELVQSPRDVATYDLRPEMSCAGVADRLIEGISSPDVAFAIVNFANPDMVGHTGSIPAVVAACEAVDVQLGRVVEAVHARGGVCLITADHGNAEQMLTPDGRPHTAHTTNPVPVIVTVREGEAMLRSGGRLADISPTVLDLLGLPKPVGMTGESLLCH